MIDGLVALLAAQNFSGIGSKVYGLTIPQGVVLPAVACTRIDTEPYESLDGTVSLESADVDIDVHALTPGPAATAARAIKAFLRNYAGAMGSHTCRSVIYLNENEGYARTSEGNAGRFIHSLSFQIQFIEA